MNIFSNLINAIKWRGLSNFISAICQIIFTAILARLLTKSYFGLIATAMLVNRFCVAFTNFGFGGAIIRNNEINENQISSIFFLQFFFKIFLSCLVFFLAYSFALFFIVPFFCSRSATF